MKIGETTINLNQANTPAPLWYRRLTNAIVLSFLPIYVGFINIIEMSDYKRSILAQIGIAIPIALKGFGMLMGNSQTYIPTNEAIDKKNELNARFIFWVIVAGGVLSTM